MAASTSVLQHHSLHRYLPPAWVEQLSFPLSPADAQRVRDHLLALLRTVVTYLPRCVVEPALVAPPSEPVQGAFHWGTVLFADVSGFTAMSERLRQSRLGREGAEAVTAAVNRYFEAMTGIAQQRGGDLLKFGGDAILLLFEGEDHAARSCMAAAEMQAAMSTDLAQVDIPGGRISLRLAIGLGTGTVFTASLGTADSLEFAVLGPALESMGRAESLAQGGQVVMDENTRQAIGETFPVEDTSQPGYYRLVCEDFACRFRLTPATPLEVPSPSGDVISQISWLLARLDTLTPYLPPGLLRRLCPDPAHPRALDETRWVTVLFAAIHGVNALIERIITPDRAVVGQIGGPQTRLERDYGDPAALTAILNDYFTTMRRCIERYEGVVNKVGAGPAGPHIMALFGAPQAHEDDPERAVLTALDMQAALEEVNARAPQTLELSQGIGVNTGFVFAGNVGSAGRREYTVMGDEVNLTFRLMTAARAGQVLVSESTAQHVKERVQLLPLPPIRVKGKSQPVVHYQALAPRALRGSDFSRYYEEPLADRERGMALIQRALEQVGRGRGQVLVVHGEAGMGKSRLVAEGVALARQQGMALLLGTCLSYGQDTPYLPWAEVLQEIFDIREEDTPPTRVEKVRLGLERIGAGEWTPVLGEVLGLPVEDTPLTAALTPRLRQQRIFDLTLALLKHRATLHGLALVIEDAHWADAASLALLDYLARNLRDAPVALFIVHRPDERLAGRWQPLPHCTDIPVGELPAPAVQEMVVNLLRTPAVPTPLYRLIAEKAQGNPLFTEEMLRALMDSGALRRDNSHWILAAELSAEQLPDTIHGLIQSRIDRLAETDRRVLQVAACIGRVFPLRTLAGVYPYGDLDGTLPHRLERLTTLGLTTLETPVPGPVYSFRHTLTQEVAYESLAYARRRELHRRIGEFIEREYAEALAQQYNILAYHFYQGQVWDKAVDYALRAGEHAQHEYANEAAIAHFRRALEAAEEGERCGLDMASARLQAHESLGDVLSVVGEYDEALEHYAAARELVEAQSPGEARDRHLADLCRKTAEVYEKKSEYETAFQWLQRGLNVLGQRETLEAAHIYRLGAGIYHRLGQNDQAIAWCRRSLDIAQKSKTEEGQRTVAHLHFLMAEIYRRYGNLEKAVQHARQSADAYQALEDAFGASQAYNTLGNVYFELGNWNEAAKFYRSGMEIKEKIGDVYGQGMIANNLGEILLYQGRLEEALAAYQRSLSVWERLNASFGTALLNNNLAAVYIRQKEWDKAESHLQSSLDLFQEIGAEDFLPELYRHLAEVDMGQGRLDEALSHAAASLEMAREHKMQLEEGIASRIVGEVYHRLGKHDWALQELHSSLELLEALDTPYEAARTHLALARLYTDLRRRDEAQTHLTRALETFRRLGAKLDLQEVQELGAKTRRV